jgi:hypothetical protein
LERALDVFAEGKEEGGGEGWKKGDREDGLTQAFDRAAHVFPFGEADLRSGGREGGREGEKEGGGEGGREEEVMSGTRACQGRRRWRF